MLREISQTQKAMNYMFQKRQKMTGTENRQSRESGEGVNRTPRAQGELQVLEVPILLMVVVAACVTESIYQNSLSSPLKRGEFI